MLTRAARQKFLRDLRGAAAVEFALVFPMLIALLAGSYELARAIQTGRRLTALVDTISMMLAATPAAAAASGATPATTGAVNHVTLHYAHDATMVMFPDVLADSYAKGKAWGADISISMAGVSFTLAHGCTTASTSAACYVAKVTWTGDAKTRACGATLASASDTATPSSSTLPVDLFTPVSTQVANIYSAPPPVIVVDVAFTWTPRAFSSLVSPITIRRSAYVYARYMDEVKYQKVSGDDGFGQRCPSES